MACERYQELFSAYLDQVLSEEEVDALEAHIGQCSSCREELSDLKETITMLRSMGEVEPPDGFREQLRQRLEAEQQLLRKEKAAQSPSLVSRIVRSPWLPLSAAAVLVLFVVTIFGAGLLMTPMGRSTQSADMAVENKAVEESAPEYGRMGIASERAAPPVDAKGDDGGGAGANYSIAGEQSLKKAEKPTPDETAERKVITRAHFQVEVKDVPQSEKSLREMATRFGGYVQSANMSKSEGEVERIYANLTLRIPQQQFDAAVEEIKSLGEVVNSNQSGEDVTRQYYDTEARLKVMQEEEESLLGLLDKAEKMEDIMQIRRELRMVRQEIEMHEGELKRLTNLTSLATIDVSLQEEKVPRNQISTTGIGGVWSRTVTAFIMSTNRVIRGLGEALIGFGALLPVLILLAAAVLILIGAFQWRRRRKSE